MTKELSQKPTSRVKRVPVGVRNKIHVDNQDPNYHYRIVNVIDARIPMFEDAGYEVAPNQPIGHRAADSPSSLGSAPSISVGQGTHAVLMRQPIEWYREDQKRKQDAIDEQEASMKSEAVNRK